MATLNPTFSIVVPVYNHARYIGAALDSIRVQTDPDWEAVVVDDGSTDATPRIVDDYARRDPRIRVFHQPNGGVSSALNTGVREARGEWICWLSSDDLFDPDKLRTHRQWFGRSRTCSFFYTSFRELDDATGRISAAPDWGAVPEPEWQVIDLLAGSFINGISICIRRDLFAAVGPFNERNRSGQDFEFFLGAFARTAATYIPSPTCIQRMHPGQGMREQGRRMFYECANAAIAFLNARRFEELFPWTDLSDPAAAGRAMERAVDVAANSSSFLYALGAHTALIGRTMEWAWAPSRSAARRSCRAAFGVRARTLARTMAGTPLGSAWKAAAVAAECGRAGDFDYGPVSALETAEAHHARLRASGDSEAEATARYIEKMGGRAPEGAPAADGAAPGEVVLVRRPDAGTDDALSRWSRAGFRCVAIDVGTPGYGMAGGAFRAGVRSAGRAMLGLASAGEPFAWLDTSGWLPLRWLGSPAGESPSGCVELSGARWRRPRARAWRSAAAAARAIRVAKRLAGWA